MVDKVVLKVYEPQNIADEKIQGEDPSARYREEMFNVAAKLIRTNLSPANKKKYSQKDIYKWLERTDSNFDGQISQEEIVASGGDIFDLAKLDKNFESKLKLEQGKIGVDWIKKALSTSCFTWPIAKKCLIKYAKKKAFDYYLNTEDSEIKKYFEQEIINSKDENVKKHYLEILRSFNYPVA